MLLLHSDYNYGGIKMSDLIKKIQDTNLYVVQGDITQIKADALMTAINPYGDWFGGIDRAIMRVAGDTYHDQAGAQMPLKNLQTIVAKGNGTNRGKFNDVVFVVDDVDRIGSPLNKIIYAGLQASNNECYGKIVIPAIRMGVMKGVVEKTPEEAIAQMNLGISNFMKDYKNQVKIGEITFVVYNDANTVRKLQKGLKQI